MDIYSYVTEKTFDAYLYQLVENKQRFIGQVMTSKSPARSAEDVDEASLSYAEIKALATGNPMIIEKCQLESDVSRLQLLRSNYINQRYELEDAIQKKYPQELSILHNAVKGYDVDIATAATTAHHEENKITPMKIGAAVYDERVAAGAALIDQCKKLQNMNEPVVIGSYRGFQLELSFSTFTQSFSLNLHGKLSHEVEIGIDPSGNTIRMDNALNALEAKRDDVQRRIINTQTQIETAQQALQIPFQHEAELKEKTERLAKVNALLSLDQPEHTAVAVDNGIDNDLPDFVPPFMAHLTDNKKIISREEAKMSEETKRVNVGYEIIRSETIDGQEYVLGYHPGAHISPYVTWACRNGNDYNWGHYFVNKEDAEHDFIHRLEEQVRLMGNRLSDRDNAMDAAKMIRFINSRYDTLFTIPDGGTIKMTRPEGETRLLQCKYLDPYHMEINHRCFHICEWAERMEEIGATYEPVLAPERENDVQKPFTRDEFFAKISYGEAPDLISTYYDNRQSYTDEVAYQRKCGAPCMASVLTREQFIAGLANDLLTAGHYMNIGATLQGDYRDELATYTAGNSLTMPVSSELQSQNQMYAAVQSAETGANKPISQRIVTEDTHTGQLFLTAAATEQDLSVVYARLNPKPAQITAESENIEVPGHTGTWYCVDAARIKGVNVFEMESEQYGDEAAHVIISERGELLLEDVYNGFDDLEYAWEDRPEVTEEMPSEALSDKRKQELTENFYAETNDPESEEWRDELTEEEAKYVESLDQKFNTDYEKFVSELAVSQDKNKNAQAVEERMVSDYIRSIAERFTTDPEVFREMAGFSAKFHQYSMKNCELIYQQNPFSTYVASFADWKKQGFSVQRGEHGIKIWTPKTVTLYEDPVTGETQQLKTASAEIKAKVAAGEIPSTRNTTFSLENVFDISQTTCPPEKYPEFFSVGLASEHHAAACKAIGHFAEAELHCPVKIGNMNSISLRGQYDSISKMILINDRLKDTAKLTTLTHELGHAMLRAQYENPDKIPSAQKELQADAFSIMLSTHLGLPIPEIRKNHLAQAWSEYQALVNNPRQNVPSYEELLSQTYDVYRSNVEKMDQYISEDVKLEKPVDMAVQIAMEKHHGEPIVELSFTGSDEKKLLPLHAAEMYLAETAQQLSPSDQHRMHYDLYFTRNNSQYERQGGVIRLGKDEPSVIKAVEEKNVFLADQLNDLKSFICAEDRRAAVNMLHSGIPYLKAHNALASLSEGLQGLNEPDLEKYVDISRSRLNQGRVLTNVPYEDAAVPTEQDLPLMAAVQDVRLNNHTYNQAICPAVTENQPVQEEKIRNHDNGMEF